MSTAEGLTMTIGDLSNWPHSVRPDGYYRNDPNPAFDLDEQGCGLDEMADS